MRCGDVTLNWLNVTFKPKVNKSNLSTIDTITNKVDGQNYTKIVVWNYPLNSTKQNTWGKGGEYLNCLNWNIYFNSGNLIISISILHNFKHSEHIFKKSTFLFWHTKNMIDNSGINLGQVQGGKFSRGANVRVSCCRGFLELLLPRPTRCSSSQVLSSRIRTQVISPLICRLVSPSTRFYLQYRLSSVPGQLILHVSARSSLQIPAWKSSTHRFRNQRPVLCHTKHHISTRDLLLPQLRNTTPHYSYYTLSSCLSFAFGSSSCFRS